MAGVGLKDILLIPVYILALPVLIVFFLIVFAIWLVFTVTFIGPAIQYFCKKRDDKLIQSTLANNASELKTLRSPGGYDLGIRFVTPKGGNAGNYGSTNNTNAGATTTQSLLNASAGDVEQGESGPHGLRRFPICMPNGLASTMATVGALQDALVASGFTVLTYDRFGVGFSDGNTTGKPPTVEDLGACVYMCLVGGREGGWIYSV